MTIITGVRREKIIKKLDVKQFPPYILSKHGTNYSSYDSINEQVIDRLTC